MSEFSSVANLEVVPTGMDAARREIENELGDIETGVTANRPTGRAMADGGAGGIGRGQAAGILDASQKQFEELGSLVELAEARNELLGDEEGGGGPGTAPTAAMIEIQRRTLRAQRASADADDVTNQLLEDIHDTLRDPTEGIGGGGGGGGGGAGGTLLQVQGARSLLGGLGGGLGLGSLGGLLSAGRLGGGAFSPGIFGQGSAVEPGGDPLGPEAQFLQDMFGDMPQIEPPEDFPPTLQVPEGFPPKLELPGQFPSIDVDAPPWLQGVAQGLGIDINVNTDNTVTVVDQETRNAERQRFENARERNNVEPIVQTEVRRMEQRLERKLKREFGAGTGTRTGGGTGGGRTR